MTGDEAELLATLPAWAFAFVLVMARIGAAMALLPGLGEAEPPVMLRVGLASAITALLLPGIAPPVSAVPEASAAGRLHGCGRNRSPACGSAGWRGCWCWPCRSRASSSPTCWASANVLQPDPELGSQATPLARLFAIAAPLVILVSGLYALPLAALAGSYPADPARRAAAGG